MDGGLHGIPVVAGRACAILGNEPPPRRWALEIAPDRLEAVRRYLRAQFPGQVIKTEWKDRNDSYGFRVAGPPRLAVVVSEAFLGDRDPSEIEQTLSDWRVAERMRAVAPSNVEVTTEGLGPLAR